MSLALTLFLSTFVLEDVALASALVLISQGQMTFFEAVSICSLGIGVGDLGLYFLGRWASLVPYLRKKTHSPQFKTFLNSLKKNRKMDYAVVISRAVPGTRIPTYLAAGVAKYSLLRFFILTVLSVVAWVVAALYFGRAFFSLFENQWALALVLFFVALFVLKKIFSLFKDEWSFKVAKHSWRKWLHFEFWPAWFFYLPIVPYYIYLSALYRSLLIPFYASPNFKHGGLIGESKWDFLKHLDVQSKSTLPFIIIEKSLSTSQILNLLEEHKIQFPLIVKPDVGQRGFAVRIVDSEQELWTYLDLCEGAVIAQQKSQYASEAGIFYIRHPNSTRGSLFSITDKKFPLVIGDGETRLGDLILADRRARIIASTYFKRHKERLGQVLAPGEKYLLAECGNHCQGALFYNGNYLATEELLNAVEQIALRIPDFYFGRLDIRYLDEASLKRGLHFEIIEINGAGSEATHIWDPNTKILDAYKTLFHQWNHLFSIGAFVKKQGLCKKPEVFRFFVDSFKVYFRKGPLTTSS